MNILAKFLVLLISFLAYARLSYADMIRPAELPPDDFRATQYIDSDGCVFTREDHRWTVRMGRDGTPICGYPPSLSSRHERATADASPFARSEPDPLHDAERELTKQIVTTLGPLSELSAHSGHEPKPPQEISGARAHAATKESPEVTSLNAQLSAVGQVKQAVGRAVNPAPRLCDLLSLESAPKTTPAIGQDPTLGYCGQSVISALPERDIAMKATGVGDQSDAMSTDKAQERNMGVERPPRSRRVTAAASSGKASDPVKAPLREQRLAEPVDQSHHRSPRKATTAANLPSRGDKRRADKRALSSSPDGIPAGARYVQLGAFGEMANAERMISRLQSLGFPVSRGKTQARGQDLTVVMAGPFNNRERLISALSALRAKGFRSAFAR